MALNKKTKTWMTVLFIPIMLLFAVIVGLKLYLTSERLKALIIPKIEEATHRTVLVQNISFTILPSLAISIDELKISNPEGMKFDKDEFLSLDNVRLKVNIFDLLSSKLNIKYIILDHPKIYLEVTPEGKSNYGTTGKTDRGIDTVETKIRKIPGGELLLSSLEINNLELEYVNKKSDIRLLIVGLNLETNVHSKPQQQSIDIEGSTIIKKLSYGTINTLYLIDQPIDGDLKLVYEIYNDILKIDNINAKMRDLPLTTTGTISGLQTESMNFNLTVASPSVQMSHILSLVPPEMLKNTQGLESSGDVKFSTTISGTLSETSTPGVIGSFTVSNGKIKYESLAKSISNINIAGSFERPEARDNVAPIGKFSLQKFGALLGNNEIAGKLSITNFDDPILGAWFAGTMNLIEVKDFYPLEKGTELTGLLNGEVSIEGPVKLPQEIKANGIIDFKNVTLKTAASPTPLRNLAGTITFNNRLIESKQLSMNIGESDLSLAFVMKNYLSLVLEDAKKAAGKPTASITLNSKQLRTTDLISEEKPSTANEKKQTNEPKAMFLPGIDVDANVSIKKLTTEKFEFTNTLGSLSIVDGIITLKNFSVNAFQGTVLTKGILNVQNMNRRPFNLDLEIVGVEANSILSKFTSFGNNLFGKFNMNAILKGDLNDTLGLNTQTLVGEGKVQIFDGKLLGFPLTTKLADYTGINEMREVTFKNWSNAFSISDGRVNIRDLKVSSSISDFSMNGYHGLDGSMAYALNVKLPESASNRVRLSGVADQLLQFFKDKDNRINLNFDVSGTTTSPSLHLNTKAQEEMAKQAIEKEKQKLLEKGKTKVEDELKKKAEEGIKKLFKKP
ncbi:MAG: AsmA-like C-terminal region-containing protein [Bacteroidota bacterium]|nr:AsmA-like C-terminal region-containing protein [Bacteroidota bacterium]